MDKLHLGVEVRDFDLERMGFSISVLDQSKKRQHSEAYLRMSLSELNAFLKALKAASDEIEVSTVEPVGRKATPPAAAERPAQRNRAERATLGAMASADLEEHLTVPISLRAAE